MTRPVSLMVALTVCLLLSACGKKLTRARYDQITPGMTLQQVEALLGRGHKVVPSKAPPGGSLSAAAAGVDLGVSGTSAGPTLLPGLSLSSGDVYEWEDGDKLIQIQFVNGKVTAKQQRGW